MCAVFSHIQMGSILLGPSTWAVQELEHVSYCFEISICQWNNVIWIGVEEP
jgi:hypothetical protein